MRLGLAWVGFGGFCSGRICWLVVGCLGLMCAGYVVYLVVWVGFELLVGWWFGLLCICGIVRFGVVVC